MKKLELFGFRFNYELKRKEFDEVEFYSDESMLEKKILYIILIIFAIVFSNNTKLIKNAMLYNPGDVIKTDIYSPKTVVFVDQVAKNKIIEQMVETQGKEYIYVANAESYSLNQFKEFINAVRVYKKIGDRTVFVNFEKDNRISIEEDIIGKYVALSEEELAQKEKKIESLLMQMYSKGIFQERDKILIEKNAERELENSFSIIDQRLVRHFAAPNYIFDEEKTKNSLKEKIAQIKGQKNKISAGDLVLKKGTILKENDMKYLDIIGIYSLEKLILKMFLNLVYLVIVSVIYYYYNLRQNRDEFLNRNKYKTQIVILTIIFALFRVMGENFNFLLPFNAFIFLMLVLISPRFTSSTGVFVLLYLLPLLNYDLKFVLVNIIAIAVITVVSRKIQTRIEVVQLGMKVAILNATLYLIISYFLNELYRENFFKAVEILVSGTFSGMIAIALLPYFEKTFNRMTSFRLLELGDLGSPLLKEFSISAPGSFQHSIMVATLSENAAEKIKANALFCRVASYYHDIGKMKRGKYYVENLSPGENPHDSLTPFMSASIIKAHTKDGIEIAKQHMIPKEIRDIMREHQGTTLIAYFYNKAKQLDPAVQMEDFRYSGPIPKTKESAIIMLADSIEAAVRSIDDKTQEKVEKLIRKIVASKIEEGQLSDADLTFREIELIVQSFKKTLTSIHHLRVKYPDINQEKK